MQQVLLVDDHHITAIGMGMIVSKVITDAVLHFSQTYQQSLQIVETEPIDLVILDLSIPDGTGTDMIDGFRQLRKEVKILIFSGRDELLNAPGYLQKGANGYLQKSGTSDEPENAIRTVIKNEVYLSPALRKQILKNYMSNDSTVQNPIDTLTIREKKVFDLIMTGKWTKEIAEELQVKHSTVSGYKSKIFQKFEVDNVVDLVKKVIVILNELG